MYQVLKYSYQYSIRGAGGSTPPVPRRCDLAADLALDSFRPSVLQGSRGWWAGRMRKRCLSRWTSARVDGWRWLTWVGRCNGNRQQQPRLLTRCEWLRSLAHAACLPACVPACLVPTCLPACFGGTCSLCRAGVTCNPGEVETWLAQLEATQEEAGVLSVDEFYRLCCAFSTAANGAAVKNAEQTADAGGDAGGDAVRPTAREAELLAALDAARSENAGLRRRLEMSGEAAPAPAARAGASGGIYDPRWTERVRPLYDEVCATRCIEDQTPTCV